MSTVQRNRLLALLAPKDLALLRPGLERVQLPLRFDLEKPNKRIADVFFIEAGIASVVAIQSDRTRVEVGLIGREGMSGISVLLGDHQNANSTYMQVGGEGQRMTSSQHQEDRSSSSTAKVWSGVPAVSTACRNRNIAVSSTGVCTDAY
jgi:hypothetical protein